MWDLDRELFLLPLIDWLAGRIFFWIGELLSIYRFGLEFEHSAVLLGSEVSYNTKEAALSEGIIIITNVLVGVTDVGEVSVCHPDLSA